MTMSSRTILTVASAGIALVVSVAAQRAQQPAPGTPTSSQWLSLLPDGEEKKRFILDCTGCHQFDERMARFQGRPRTHVEWDTTAQRMLRYAGARTGFPVIAATRNAAETATWLVSALGDRAPVAASAPQGTLPATVDEFMLPEERDLPHDVAVDAQGNVVITGMMTHTMYVLNPATKEFRPVAIPIPNANPRALDLDTQGNWWVALGGPRSVLRYDVKASTWATYPIGVYPHSVAIAPDGRAWANGHFTRSPELMMSIDHAAKRVDTVTLPPHPTLANVDGGPIPYEIRVAPNGRVWVSELGGNRLVSYDPRDKSTSTFEIPVTNSGPRRFDIDARGVLWIPLYSANRIVRYDPAATPQARFKAYELPIRDALPYVVKVDPSTGMVWIGTGAADALVRFDPRTERFATIPLPSRGAMVRHLALDPRTHDVWAAYGASPGIAARVARIRVRQ